MIEIIWLLVQVMAGLCLLLVSGLGVAVLIALVKPMDPPADTSNRIAHFKIVWRALKSPEDFVDLFRFRDGKYHEAYPWLRMDDAEYDEYVGYG